MTTPTQASDSTDSSAQRLNKFVALALGVSRRQADELIKQGTVTVNDQPAKLGQRITTTEDRKSQLPSDRKSHV